MTMELDDLKQTWQQTPANDKTNTDIMDIIQHKSYGPIAAMKRELRKHIAFMALLPFILMLTNITNIEGVFRSVMYWSYVLFCIGAITHSYYNYRIVSRMGIMDVMIKASLEQQVELLERRIRQSLIWLRFVMIYFIILCEVVPYFQHYRMLAYWHGLSPWIRYAAYAGLLAMQYFTSKAVARRKYGEHLNYLRQLTKELQH
jgi:hypothetical protein